MRRILIFLCLFVSIARAQTGEDIMKQSAAKISKLTTLSYSIYAEEYGEKMTADVLINRKDSFPVFEMAQIKLNGIVIGSEGSRQISFASDGNSFEYLKEAQVIRLDHPTYPKLSRTGMSPYFLLIPAPYFQKEPFSRLFDIAKKMEYSGDSTIFNEDCYKIIVTTEFTDPARGTKVVGTTSWFIGKKDLLIHGLVSSVSNQWISIRSTGGKVSDESFQLSSTNAVKQMTGTEILNEGLLALNTKAPDWTLPTSVDSITLSKLKGKVVLLDFWGTWCLPCIRSMPGIQAVHDYFKNKNVVIIGVSVEMEKAARPLEFVKNKGYTYTIVLNGSTITKAYKVTEFPSLYIIDKNGMIIHAEHGANREGFKEELIAKIEKALAD
jgi:peroxiredoxin